MKNIIIFFGFLGAILVAVSAQAANDLNEFIGEKITYSIKKIGMKAGEATLSYEGPVSRENRDFVLIVFKADGLNFLDSEKIYADPKTLLPQIVERDLDIFGKKEQIVEYYEPQNGRVRIVKTAEKGKKEEQVISKKGTIDNIYCFIYRYRRDAEFRVGDTVAINLPTMDIKIKVTQEVHLNTAGKKYDAFLAQSTPAKYKLWFDVGPQKIPLRIDGALGFGSTTMTMKSYESKSAFALLGE